MTLASVAIRLLIVILSLTEPELEGNVKKLKSLEYSLIKR